MAVASASPRRRIASPLAHAARGSCGRTVSGPRIRPFLPGDQAALEAFFTTAWRESRFGFDPTGAHADLRAIPATYQSGRGGFWLLGDRAEILGTVALRDDQRSTERAGQTVTATRG